MLCFVARRPSLLIQSAIFPALCVALLALLSQPLAAQAAPGSSPASLQGDPVFKALMVSDLHVDVFDDPKKANELASAPASRWAEILARPDSATRAQDSKALHAECGEGADPSPSLFAS